MAKDTLFRSSTCIQVGDKYDHSVLQHILDNDTSYTGYIPVLASTNVDNVRVKTEYIQGDLKLADDVILECDDGSKVALAEISGESKKLSGDQVIAYYSEAEGIGRPTNEFDIQSSTTNDLVQFHAKTSYEYTSDESETFDTWEGSFKAYGFFSPAPLIFHCEHILIKIKTPQWNFKDWEGRDCISRRGYLLYGDTSEWYASSEGGHHELWTYKDCKFAIFYDRFYRITELQLNIDCIYRPRSVLVAYPYFVNGVRAATKTSQVSTSVITLSSSASLRMIGIADTKTFDHYTITQWKVRHGETVETYAGLEGLIAGDCEIVDVTMVPKEFTISFDSCTGDPVITVRGRYMETITCPSPYPHSDPRYTFDGWWTQKEGGTFYGNDGSQHLVLNGGTVFAHWILPEADGIAWYQIVNGMEVPPRAINGNDRSFLITIGDTASYGTIRIRHRPKLSQGTLNITLPSISLLTLSDPVATDDTYDVKITPSTPTNSEPNTIIGSLNGITEYAHIYVIRKHENTITYDWNDGKDTKETRFLEEGRATDIPTPTKEREGIVYRFNGWLTPRGELLTKDSLFTSSVTVTASWTRPREYDGRDWVILQMMTSDKEHSGIAKQFNLATIPQFDTMYSIPLATMSATAMPSSRAFAMDTGLSKVFSIQFIRQSPRNPDDAAENTDRWSNAKWITEMRSLVDRFQADTDGLKIAFIPGDCKRYTLNGRNHYFGQYMKLIGYVHDPPKYDVATKQDLTSRTDAVRGDTGRTNDGKWYLLDGDPRNIDDWKEDTDGQIGQAKDRLGIGYRYTNVSGETHWYLGENGYSAKMTFQYDEGTPDIIKGSLRFSVGGLMENRRD